MDIKITRVNILKMVGGYKANVLTDIVDEEVLMEKDHRENFFVLEVEQIEKIKQLERYILEKLNLNTINEEQVKNITNVDVLKIGLNTRVNVSIDTMDKNGVLIDSNHRYSFQLEMVQTLKSDNITTSVMELEKYALKKINVINSQF